MDSFKCGVIKNKLCTEAKASIVRVCRSSNLKPFNPRKSLPSPLFDHKKLSEIAFEIQMNFGFKTLTTVRFAVALWTAHAVNPLESFPAQLVIRLPCLALSLDRNDELILITAGLTFRQTFSANLICGACAKGFNYSD